MTLAQMQQELAMSKIPACFEEIYPQDLQVLPEDTSLQRAVKQLYLEGGYIHEGEGFFF